MQGAAGMIKLTTASTTPRSIARHARRQCNLGGPGGGGPSARSCDRPLVPPPGPGVLARSMRYAPPAFAQCAVARIVLTFLPWHGRPNGHGSAES